MARSVREESNYNSRIDAVAARLLAQQKVLFSTDVA
jgi:hypothetical protein